VAEAAAGTTASRLERRLAPLQRLPPALRWPLVTWMVGRTVPFVGTGGVCIQSLGREGVLLSLPLRRRVANHLGSAHAVAQALLAETAGGLAFAMHIPVARTPVVKRMEISYRRIARGTLTASARVPQDALARLQTETSGEVVVPVDLRDETGGDLVDCHLVYAWFTRDAAQGR
jgi:acyl-coenzyme A thioesterase PaaI-like protein